MIDMGSRGKAAGKAKTSLNVFLGNAHYYEYNPKHQGM